MEKRRNRKEGKEDEKGDWRGKEKKTTTIHEAIVAWQR